MIATEDRLGAPTIVSSGPRVTVRVEREGRRQNGNGNENDNRSVRSNGGGQTAQTTASGGSIAVPAGASSAVATPALRDGSVGVVVTGTEMPAKGTVTLILQKTPRPTFVSAQSVESGQPRTSAIPAPVGVKPPPEE